MIAHKPLFKGGYLQVYPDLLRLKEIESDGKAHLLYLRPLLAIVILNSKFVPVMISVVVSYLNCAPLKV